jgi:hypothetical protein
VAHEALLRNWRPLRDAIDASLAWLRTRSELERLASDWARGGRDESYALRGGRLSALDQWTADHDGDIGPLERQFLQASRELASKERSFFKRFRAGNEELQTELRKRDVQLLEQASRLQEQEDQLRQQAIRLRDLAEFDQQSNMAGGVFISYSHDDKDVIETLAYRLTVDRINYWLDEKDLFVGDVVDKAISKGIQAFLAIYNRPDPDINCKQMGRKGIR